MFCDPREGRSYLAPGFSEAGGAFFRGKKIPFCAVASTKNILISFIEKETEEKRIWRFSTMSLRIIGMIFKTHTLIMVT